MQHNLSGTQSGSRWRRIVGGFISFSLLAAVLACISPADLLNQPGPPQQVAGVATATNTPAGQPATRTRVPGTPTATRTNTPTPSRTPRVTFTPLPTHTSNVPTNPPPAPIVIAKTSPPAQNTAVPTSTPTPTPKPTNTPSSGCGYDSDLLDDVTIPDGTEIEVSTFFTKTWDIKNNGCHGWPEDLEMVFVSGNQMGGPDRIGLPHTQPGKSREVSIDFKAPKKTGTYTSNWRLEDPDGNLFGDTFDVRIKVVTEAVSFDAVYTGRWTCTSGSTTRYEYGVEVTNTSTLTFRSVKWTLKQGSTTITSLQDNTPFQSVQSASNCGASSLQVSSLASGDSAWVSGFVAKKALPTGKSGHLVLEICTDDDLDGSCTTVTVNFTT